MAKEWKTGYERSVIGDARLWGTEEASSTRVYYLRIGWREYRFTRGELLLSLLAGLFAGLVYAAAQAGYLHLPDNRPDLGYYQPPKPRLLGSTEPTRPEAGDPDMHFVDARGRGVSRPVVHRQQAVAAAPTQPDPLPSPNTQPQAQPMADGADGPVPVV